MIIEADLTIRPYFTGCYGGKTPDEWSEDEKNRFKNELVSEFNMYDLGAINAQPRTMLKNFKVVSFE